MRKLFTVFILLFFAQAAHAVTVCRLFGNQSVGLVDDLEYPAKPRHLLRLLFCADSGNMVRILAIGSGRTRLVQPMAGTNTGEQRRHAVSTSCQQIGFVTIVRGIACIEFFVLFFTAG